MNDNASFQSNYYSDLFPMPYNRWFRIEPGFQQRTDICQFMASWRLRVFDPTLLRWNRLSAFLAY